MLESGLLYFRVLTMCLLLVYFVNAAGCHCFDLIILKIAYSAEICPHAHNTTTSKPPVSFISQILTTFKLYSGIARTGQKVSTELKVRQK